MRPGVARAVRLIARAMTLIEFLKMATSSEREQAVGDGGKRGLERALSVGRSAFLGFLMKRLGNRADAEDVLQEFCIRVLARKHQLQDADRIDAWFYAVLRSALNDYYRKTGRMRRLNDAVALEMKSAEVTEESAEAMAVVCGCVRGLVPQLRAGDAELIQRIDIDDEKRETAAASLNLRRGTLNVRLHRARTVLRDMLLSHCGFCCQHGFDDCSCPPAGCEHPVEQTDCADRAAEEQ